MILITSQKEIKEYIEDLKFNISLYRLEDDRINSSMGESYKDPSALKTSEIWFSELLSRRCDEDRRNEYHIGKRKRYPRNIDKDTFDGVVIEPKEQTLIKLLQKYTEGISIHPMGWMCPNGQENYFQIKIGDSAKLFGKDFL